MPSGEGHLVPDLLAPGLRLVLIGTAPSRISARAGAYYANPHNKFWRVLAEVGLTPRLFAPQEFPALLALGHRPDRRGQEAQRGGRQLARRTPGNPARCAPDWRTSAPSVAAFTSKRGASQVLGVPTGKLAYGPQAALLEGVEVWVLPSTSPLGHNHFQLGPWQALARRVEAQATGNPQPAEDVL